MSVVSVVCGQVEISTTGPLVFLRSSAECVVSECDEVPSEKRPSPREPRERKSHIICILCNQ